MKAVVATTSALFLALLFGAFALMGFVALAAGTAESAATTATVSNPSDDAVADIPPLLLELFVGEAQRCRGLPWTVMAGISKVESDHARFGGATIDADGTVAPPIIGIALDGTNGTARITDTDNGTWDNDPIWDRAVGPLQFIPSSWRIFGGDGNDDGVADPQNVFDAVPAMRRHLCPSGTIADIEAALFAYNRSRTYVATVLEWAHAYTGTPTEAAIATAGYALPVPPSATNADALVAPHHTYPAWDLGISVGTPLYSIVAGTVSVATIGGIFPTDPNRCGTTVMIAGVDGATYTYCHLSQLAATAGQTVEAGTPIGLSGGQPGAPGAGNTTGPHLHLGITIAGSTICPQPLLLSIHRRTPINPAIAPTGGCVQGLPTTNWPAWLDGIGIGAPQTTNQGD